jgi:hypothetical protein
MQKPRLQNFWGCCFFNPFVWVLLLCVHKWEDDDARFITFFSRHWRTDRLGFGF